MLNLYFPKMKLSTPLHHQQPTADQPLILSVTYYILISSHTLFYSQSNHSF